MLDSENQLIINNANTNLGEWTLVSEIDDSGGNGIVWKAKNSSGDIAALKILRSFDNAVKAEKRSQRFLNEIAALKYIQQRQIPRVMRILDHGFTDDGSPWYAMPIAQPLDLREKSAEETIRGMIDVADTIAALHEIGMEHRDIKPTNLLILKNEIVVSDFGLARMVGDEHFTVTGERVGSMGYTASECIGKSDKPRFECDVYALGKTTWVFLKGAERPPNGELRSPNDDLNNLGLPDSGINIPLVQELLFSATERDPNARPTARQFREGLSAALQKKESTTVQTNASPAARARSLFRNDASRNMKDRETNQIYLALCQELTRRWVSSWKDLVESLGWRTTTGSGGYMGSHTLKLDEGWQAGQRNCFSGSIQDTRYNIAITYRRKEMRGSLNLLFGFTIAIQVFEEVQGSNSKTTEYVICSEEFDTFSKGPQFEQTRYTALATVEANEIQFRAIERLNLLVENRS